MSHSKPPSSNSQYRPEIPSHTNVTDYEKFRQIPEDRFSPPGRDTGLYSLNSRTARGSLSSYTSPHHNHNHRTDDQPRSFQYASGDRQTSRNLSMNIKTDEPNTSPTSNLTLSHSPSNYQNSRTSPLDHNNPDDYCGTTNLYPEDTYQSAMYSGHYAGDRRDTMLSAEDHVFTAIKSDDDYTVNTPMSMPYSNSQYSLPTQSTGASRRDLHANSMESLPRYSHSNQAHLSELRKSHQELTSESMRHKHTPSIRTSSDHIRALDSYRTLSPSSREHRTGLDSKRHSHSTSDLISRTTANYSGDLTKWQQLHQQQLALQKANTQALSTLNPKSASLSSLHGGYAPNVTSMYHDHNALGALRNVADDIIQEKDKVIEDLRIQLEGGPYTSSYSSPLPHRSLQTGTEINQLKSHAQDLEYQNALLKNRLDEISKSQNTKIDSLELQLGATEHELRAVKSDLTDKQKHSLLDSAEIQNKIMEKDTEIQEWHRRFLEMRDGRIEVKKKLDGLQRYLSDLPTTEDAAQSDQQLKNLQEETSSQKTTIETLERKVIKAKKIITVKDMEFKRVVEQNAKLSNKLAQVQEELETIKLNGLGEKLSHAQADVQQLKRDKERVRIDLEKSKKMLEDRHRLTKQADIRHKLDVTKLEERLSQEEGTVMALREESAQREEQIRKLRQSIKELSVKNQDLLEQTMIQKENLCKFELHSTEETQKLERQLSREMRQCFYQLRSVVRVCMDRAEGQDPDMSLILGTRGMADVESDDEYSQSSQSGSSSQASGSSSGRGVSLSDTLTLKNRLSKINTLKKDIEKLRDLMANQIAEDLGRKIECAQQ